MSLDVWLTDTISSGRHIEVFEANITHNLGKMACALRIYREVWHPEYLNIKKAEELISPLKHAIRDLEARPEYYKKYNASNGWGLYKHFLPWLKDYWKACVNNREASIKTST